MKVAHQHYRTIWFDDDAQSVNIIDQTKLPHDFVVCQLRDVHDAAHAIRSMQVRGAPLIGATAAYGMLLAMLEDASDQGVQQAAKVLAATRPTAINLNWALKLVSAQLLKEPSSQRAELAKVVAANLCDEDVACCDAIGQHGCALIEANSKAGKTINIMTHCNAGWLATVDWGTALAPIYKAFDKGIDLHVWVSETRPRNQGMYLTAWELAAHGVPHTVIADNNAGYLMQRGEVDLVIVGTDRTLVTGAVCNKIGTYMKALAAKAHDVPFYVAAPSSSIEWAGLREGRSIPIEQRDDAEVHTLGGKDASDNYTQVQLCGSRYAMAPTAFRNDAFDVTPAELVTGLITERGLCAANEAKLLALFPEHTR